MPGEVGLMWIVDPTAGHEACIKTSDAGLSIDGHPAQPVLDFTGGLELGVDEPAMLRCDGSGTSVELRHRALRMDNSGGTEPMVASASWRLVTGRRRLVAAGVAKTLPDGSRVPVRTLTADEARSLLRPDTTLDFEDASFQGWLDQHSLRRAAHETVLDFTLRAQAALADMFQYAGQVHVVEHASNVADGGNPLKAHCHGCTLTLLSILRANRVPCRARAGTRVCDGKVPPAPGVEFPEATPVNMCQGGHTWCEVFVPGVGFVPVEPQGKYQRTGFGFGDDAATGGALGFCQLWPPAHTRAPRVPIPRGVMDAVQLPEAEAAYLRCALAAAGPRLDKQEAAGALPHRQPFAVLARKGAPVLVGLTPATQRAANADHNTGRGFERRYALRCDLGEVLVDNAALLGLS